MKDFFAYFFGASDGVVEFRSFTFAHFAPILVMIGLILLIRRFCDRLRGYRHEARVRFALAFTMIVCEMSYFWRLVGVPSLGANPVDHLPITVCGWATIFASYMLITGSQNLFDIAYFWFFSGTVFALITPTVITYTGPTRFRYYQFWGEHTLGYIAIFYMIFVHGMRPNFRSVFKAYGALAVLAVIAYAANSMLGPGANYLYMAAPEDTPSILDILPPNHALRIFVMFAVITVMFALAYLPWYLIDRRRARAATPAEGAAPPSAE